MLIDSVPTVKISGCLIEQNANGDGGNAGTSGFSGSGGYGSVTLTSVGSATIEDTMLRGNYSGNGGNSMGPGSLAGYGGRGGALVAESSNVVMLRSSVVDNNAGSGGAGESGGPGGDGGGLYFPGTSSALIANTTISGNSAGSPNGRGGGVAADQYFALINCTLSDNAAGNGGDGGNLSLLTDGSLSNSVLANQEGGGDCFTLGTVHNGGNNIVEDNSCGFSGGSDPRLAPLGTYGGVTLSRALCTAAGVPDASCVGPSPAIDAGSDATCSDMLVNGVDQGASLRNVGAHCDIGAIESNANASIAMTGDAALFPGGSACIGVRAAAGYPLATLTTQLNFSGTDFALVDSQINPLIGPSTASDKQLSHLSLGASSDLFTVFGGNGPIPSGLAFTAVFTASPSTAPGIYPITPLPFGNLVVTTCAGDCDGNGSVTIKELQQCKGKFLGQPLCDLQDPGHNCTVVDSDANGVVSLADVQRCANRFVGSCL